MQHCESESLALIALGEPAISSDADHVAICAACRLEVERLSAVVAIARSVTPADQPSPPPAAVWDRIADELGMAPGPAVTSIADVPSRRRPRTWLVAAAAAAVGVIVGGSVVAGALNAGTTEQVVASTVLDPIDDSGFEGTATVTTGDEGTSLTVVVPNLPAVDGYYEVWMATPDTATMIAMGTLRPGQPTTFALPPGLEVTSFPVVDVSVEHFDGDTGHSAVSVVRGELPA